MSFYDSASGAVRRIYEARSTLRQSSIPQPRLQIRRFTVRGRRSATRRLPCAWRKVPRFHEIMPEQTISPADDGLDWRMFVLKAYDVPGGN